jgi:hypothetical protein
MGVASPDRRSALGGPGRSPEPFGAPADATPFFVALEFRRQQPRRYDGDETPGIPRDKGSLSGASTEFRPVGVVRYSGPEDGGLPPCLPEVIWWRDTRATRAVRGE